MTLVTVAGFAAGNAVFLGAFAAAGNGNEVIHGHLGGRKLGPAVMTYAGPDLLFPPLRLAKLAGLGLFSFLVFGRCRGKEIHKAGFYLVRIVVVRGSGN